MRRLIRLIACSLLLALVAACGEKSPTPATEEAPPPLPATAEAPAKQPSAEEILRAMAEVFKGLKSFQVDSTQTIRIQTQGRNEEMVVETAIAAERPNRLVIRRTLGPQQLNVVSDGEKLYVHITGEQPGQDKYMESEAPQSFAGLAENPILSGTGGGGAIFLKLLTDDPYEALLEGVSASEYVGKETIDQRPLHHLRLTREKTGWDYWITAEEKPVLYRLSFDMSEAMAAAGTPAGEMTAINEQTYTNWQLDPQPTADTFSFVPPPGAEKVESLFGPPEEPKSPLLGNPAPDVQVQLLDGKGFSLASYRDKNVVMLDFWATWCGPCVQEIPILAEVAAQYAGQGLIFCALNQGEDAETIQKFLDDQELDITVGLDSAGAMGGAYGVQGIPTLVLVDKKGTVQSVHIGYNPDIKNVLQEELDALLAGKALTDESEPVQSEPADKPAE